MSKIGLLSDLHLEGSNMDFVDPGWDILVIAGDLSVDWDLMFDFFKYKAPQNIPIVYVLGNHEFEGRRINDVIPKLKEKLKEFENIHILNNESVVINNIKFIGATLWSNFEGQGLENKKVQMDWAKFNVCDFNTIFYKNENGQYVPLNPQQMEKLNQESYNYINYELTKNPFEGEKIVVTHFAPHKNSIDPKYRNTMSAYWVNHFEELMGYSAYWFHGHTHTSMDYTVEGTKVICNPRGYSKVFNQNQNQDFKKDFYIEINSCKNNNFKIK